MRVILTTEPYAPIFCVWAADLDQAEFNDGYPQQVRDAYPALFRPGPVYLGGWSATDARAAHVAVMGWEVVEG